MSFLGRQVWTYTGLSWLHRQSGAPLVFAAAERDQEGGVTVRCSAFDVAASPTHSPKAADRQLMQQVYTHYAPAGAVSPFAYSSSVP